MAAEGRPGDLLDEGEVVLSAGGAGDEEGAETGEGETTHLEISGGG